MTDSQKLDLLLDEIKGVESRLERKMQEMKESLREEMQEMKEGLREEMQEMKETTSNLRKEMKEIEKSLRDDNHSIRLLFENEICVNIKRIAEGHLDLARNLKEAQKPSQELEVLTLKVNTLEREVGELKRKIS